MLDPTLQPIRRPGSFLQAAARVLGAPWPRPGGGGPRSAGRRATGEHGRLRVLHALSLLDTAHEPFLDAIVASAATIANTPIAALSLVDADRQWFKGSFGIDVAETPLENSFCRHTIADARPLVVPDTRRDARFANHPAIPGGMRVHFYAGFPLIVGGHAVGALCVADDHPRHLGLRQHERLAALAAGAVAWIETNAAKGR